LAGVPKRATPASTHHASTGHDSTARTAKKMAYLLNKG